MRSAFGEFQAGTGHEIGSDSRHQDFARLGFRQHAGSGMNGDGADIAASQFDFTGVKACTQR
jgi:hypothetical protein